MEHLVILHPLHVLFLFAEKTQKKKDRHHETTHGAEQKQELFHMLPAN